LHDAVIKGKEKGKANLLKKTVNWPKRGSPSYNVMKSSGKRAKKKKKGNPILLRKNLQPNAR